MKRREFLSLAVTLPLSSALAAPAARKKSVAVILTEYSLSSHADVIAGRILNGYEYYGRHVEPRLQVPSMYTDQVPAKDMSREVAARHDVTLYPTVREALTLGGPTLAVDGVVLIGEHGRYPYNEKGQHLYPRHKFFRQIVAVFEGSGRSVPVFNDKHLSYDWEKAKWMYDASRRLGFPLLAGSSVPVAWRRPELELPPGARLRRAVCTFSGGKETYGFHALEGLQCMAERRAGGETGVARVQCLDGARVWQWTDANPWAQRLLAAALERSDRSEGGSLRDDAAEPSVFLVTYRDGLEAVVYRLKGYARGFTFAGDLEGRNDPVSTRFWLQGPRYHAHFAGLTHYIEELMLTGKAAYPVERTLLTTGVLAAIMDSAYQRGAVLDTPQLAVRYQAVAASLYNRGPVPAPEVP